MKREEGFLCVGFAECYQNIFTAMNLPEPFACKLAWKAQ
jgi:hypothetical protein